MALEVRIQGKAGLEALAAQMRTEGRKDLAKEMDRALLKVSGPVQRAIRSEAKGAMPSGYEATFSKSLRFRNNRRTGGQRAVLSLVTFADGKAERRDIVALEKGELRHPHYGNRERWYVTKISAGFHRRGTDQAMDEAVDQLDVVVRDFSQRLIG